MNIKTELSRLMGKTNIKKVGCEVDDKPFYICRLSKDGEDFFFTKYKLGNVSVTIRGIGVQCDVRIIKASSGKVIWCKRFKGVEQSQLINGAFFNFGHSKISLNLYTKAMDKAAQKIADHLLKSWSPAIYLKRSNLYVENYFPDIF